MEKIVELKKDITELERLLNLTTRQKCKDILTIEIRKLVSEIVILEGKLKIQNDPTQNIAAAIPPAGVVSSNRKYQVKISQYAWDQSDKFVKFYISLKNVHSVAVDNVHCDFASNSVNLLVKDLDNKDHSWQIKNLLFEIDPQKSSWKVKTDNILINAAKKTSDHWSHLTEWEKKAQESKSPKFDADKMDPSEGLMSLMKNMYDSGDDEMKRTIAKAWTESQRTGGRPAGPADFL